jgi:hypothetical protein
LLEKLAEEEEGPARGRRGQRVARQARGQGRAEHAQEEEDARGQLLRRVSVRIGGGRRRRRRRGAKAEADLLAQEVRYAQQLRRDLRVQARVQVVQQVLGEPLQASRVLATKALAVLGGHVVGHLQGVELERRERLAQRLEPLQQPRQHALAQPRRRPAPHERRQQLRGQRAAPQQQCGLRRAAHLQRQRSLEQLKRAPLRLEVLQQHGGQLVLLQVRHVAQQQWQSQPRLQQQLREDRVPLLQQEELQTPPPRPWRDDALLSFRRRVARRLERGAGRLGLRGGLLRLLCRVISLLLRLMRGSVVALCESLREHVAQQLSSRRSPALCCHRCSAACAAAAAAAAAAVSATRHITLRCFLLSCHPAPFGLFPASGVMADERAARLQSKLVVRAHALVQLFHNPYLEFWLELRRGTNGWRVPFCRRRSLDLSLGQVQLLMHHRICRVAPL